MSTVGVEERFPPPQCCAENRQLQIPMLLDSTAANAEVRFGLIHRMRKGSLCQTRRSQANRHLSRQTHFVSDEITAAHRFFTHSATAELQQTPSGSASLYAGLTSRTHPGSGGSIYTFSQP
ncbi:hypothetical protein Q8A73_000308 [Channa argus]|nr:hypothetical protein Q8A73_000308 [Channa argus]